MLGVCAATGAGEYATFCAVLTGYAESDFRSTAVQHGSTFGVYQQNPKYWPSAHEDTAAQCAAFLADFWVNRIRHTGDALHDCWVTQRWAVPNEGKTWPDPGPGFLTAPETVNYSRRVADVPRLIKTGVL